MADTPSNEKLWALVVMQARMKYHPYPSPGASAWVHKRYIELGGKFERTDENTKRKKMLKRHWEERMKDKRAHGDHSAKDDKKNKDK